MKRLACLLTAMIVCQPVWASSGDNFIGTEAIGTVGGTPNIYYQMGLNPSTALRFQMLYDAGTTWIYGGYRYYYTQHEDGLYVEGDLGLGTTIDLVLSAGIEFRQDDFLVDPNLRLSRNGFTVGLNFAYAY